MRSEKIKEPSEGKPERTKRYVRTLPSAGDVEIRSSSSAEKSGDDGEEDTPVPIPNTEVKLFSAEGTWGETPWESRTLPGNQ